MRGAASCNQISRRLESSGAQTKGIVSPSLLCLLTAKPASVPSDSSQNPIEVDPNTMPAWCNLTLNYIIGDLEIGGETGPKFELCTSRKINDSMGAI